MTLCLYQIGFYCYFQIVIKMVDNRDYQNIFAKKKYATIHNLKYIVFASPTQLGF